jgi:4-amino-4-deoxy-L-arabinose transferase-like glycosyltransferase
MVSRIEPPGHRGSDPSASSERSTLWIVVALTLLAALLRFYRIGNQNLWLDEVTALHAVNMGGGLSLREFFTNIQGPLHAWIVWLVTQVTMREAALRSVSAVASVATVPIVYLLGKALFDRRAGLLAALLFAVSPFSVWYAQEVKNYAMLHAFGGLSTLLAFRLVQRRGGSCVAYVVSMIVALYLNLSAVFLAVGHNLFAAGRLLNNGRFLRKWVVAYVIVIAAFVPSLWGVAHWFDQSEVTERMVFAPAAEEQTLLRGGTTFTPVALPYSVFAMGYGLTLGPSLKALHLDPTAGRFLRHAHLVIPAGVALAAALLLGLVRAARNRLTLGLIVSITITVFAGASLSALWNIKPYTVRYISVILPVFVVVMGAGIGRLPRWPRAALAGVIILMCGVSLVSHYFDPEHWKEDVRSAARYIEEHELPGDVVVVPVVLDVFDYYFEGAASRFAVYPAEAVSAERVVELVEERRGQASRLWLIDARLWGADPERWIPEYLNRRYTRVDRQTFPNTELSLYVTTGGAEADRGAAPQPS